MSDHVWAGSVDIDANQVTPFFSVELRGDTGRIHQIAKYHRDMPALAGGFRRRGITVGAAIGGADTEDAVLSRLAISRSN
jgi:hypothetical protein